ncbi:MAG: hypothetical protein QGG25_18900 [Phycisphaerae bacterium]|jgi:hypothetical protein|nr:hypothetical protein [Phycisphaerae bacterium]
MIAFVIAIVMTIVLMHAAFYLDQRLLDCRNPTRMFLSLMLLGTGVWLVSIIQSSMWLRTPGAYGPVQFWHNSAAGSEFMGVRVLALFLAFGGLLIAAAVMVATVIGLFVESSVPKWRRCIVPVISLAIFAAGYYVFFYYEFFPSV